MVTRLKLPKTKGAMEQDVIDKIMAENGKDIAAEKAKTTKAEGERDNYKDQLATATESLEKFKDVDPTAMQGEIDKLNQQLKDKDAEYAAKEADRIFADTIKEAIKTAGGRNEKAVMAMEIDKLNQQLKDKDAEYAAKEADRIFADTIKEAIKTAGGRNEKAVMAMLDMDALKASKNQSEESRKH